MSFGILSNMGTFLFKERASTVGGGEIVQQFIRSLPPAPRPRASAFNANTAQSARPSQTTSRSQNMQLSSEISNLKQQMAEMKEILQMTFEMQMDTQRAIRQEVSAVFSAFMQQMSQGWSELLIPSSFLPPLLPSPLFHPLNRMYFIISSVPNLCLVNFGI